MKKYEHLFKQNEKSNGGSLYIQSKVSTDYEVSSDYRIRSRGCSTCNFMLVSIV